jgi:hypothetical protein
VFVCNKTIQCIALKLRSQHHRFWFDNNRCKPLRYHDQNQDVLIVKTITRAGTIVFRNPLKFRKYIHVLPCSLKPRSNFHLLARHLSVLPSSSLGRVGSNSVEAQASIVELDALQGNVHLPRVVLSGASNEAAVLVRKVAERLAARLVPAVLDGSLRDGSGVGDGVLDSTGLGVDVDLLAARDDGAHSEGVVAAGEVGVVAGRAGAGDLGDVGRAVRGRGLVEPEGVVGGRDGLVVDGRGGADGE